MNTWVIVILIVFLLLLLAMVGGGMYYIVDALRDLRINPQPGPAPTPSNYAELARQAVADDQTGLADEYAAGLLFAAGEKLYADPAKKLSTRQQFVQFLSDLGIVGGYGEPYQITMEPLIRAGFAWMEKPGAFTDADRRRASNELRAMGVAFDTL